MRVIVISDTHGNFHILQKILDRHQSEASLVIFLGDGLREFEAVQALYPKLEYHCVAGNCDFASMAKRTDLVFAAGKRLLITHGDSFGVKSSTERLLKTARDNHADIALFGHTHCGMTQFVDGIYLMNPGSPARPRGFGASYGIIDLMPNGIFLNLVKL